MARHLELDTNTWAPLSAVIDLSLRMNTTLDERYPGTGRRKHASGRDVFVAEGTRSEIAEALEATAGGTDGSGTPRPATRTLAESLLEELDASGAEPERVITVFAGNRADAGAEYQG